VDRGPDAIDLTQDDLRAVGWWALAFVERALPVFEAQAPSDPRPRDAVAGLKAFASGGRRTARLRELAWAAWAAREVGDPAAAAAARAASLAAGIAYTHPLATPHQAKHTLGPVAYAAWAIELAAGGDPEVGEAEVRRALELASPQVRDVVCRMTKPVAGRGRPGALIRQLDAGLRGGPTDAPEE
jgi:hypothetical protein